MARNRLAETASPYLKQHADNPVHWQPWDDAALAEARARRLPIHLSIGYAACHWCHVMANESFSDPGTADYLNQNFVNIKVDREERPDIDQVYMAALHSLGEPGGWPLTMFLTPEARPFWGGTYFPPTPRWGRPSFRQVLQAVTETWHHKPETVTTNTEAITTHLTRGQHSAPPPEDLPDPELLNASAAQILAHFDLDRGGLSGAPKFPQAPLLEMLWRAHLRTGNTAYSDAVLITLRNICQGGIYDHLGGGFARYAVDDTWLVPHFEKMLSDNGQLLYLLCLAYEKTQAPLFRARMEETANWLLTEMRLPCGAFATSLDADTDHEEGATYVWSAQEIENVLGPDAARHFCEIYDVTPGGNWESHNILNRLRPTAFDWRGADEEATLTRYRESLLKVRNRRPQPSRDDKVLTDWNAVLIAALARTSAVLSRPDLLRAASEAFAFLTKLRAETGSLPHAWCDGRITADALATDHAQMMRAALELHVATGEKDYIDSTKFHFSKLEASYYNDDSGSYYLGNAENQALFARLHSDSDEATPAATGVIAEASTRLFLLTGERRYLEQAETILRHQTRSVARNLIATASLQNAWDTLLRARHLTVFASRSQTETALHDIIAAEADPALIAEYRTPTTATETGLRLCDMERCYPDVTRSEEIGDLLSRTRSGHTSGKAQPR
ncbi:thioredoxin domain-containing protein [Afifella sp. H1R]|uniref:thioredoxin domain-containing protein n=1 Tax=Afifella sp. H1R TaxID=2908841 RepID=UPI001F3198C7|nr:thioredoxin domain-containing protein [Afifella sp. H1R]MCF1505128.1 thioredoxin domain-containing protein [Afifella sp. H1R]